MYNRKPNVIAGLKQMGFEHPTNIQVCFYSLVFICLFHFNYFEIVFQSYLPTMLGTHGNVLAQSCSGSGKGIAVIALMLNHANKNIGYPHIIGIVHTSEVAHQINEKMLAMMKSQTEKYTVHLAVTGQNS